MDANRYRWNMGQRELNFGFDLPYIRLIVKSIDRSIEIEAHNAKNTDIHFNARLIYEEKIQELEQLLSEIELCYAWELFDFQREMLVEGKRCSNSVQV